MLFRKTKLEKIDRPTPRLAFSPTTRLITSGSSKWPESHGPTKTQPSLRSSERSLSILGLRLVLASASRPLLRQRPQPLKFPNRPACIVETITLEVPALRQPRPFGQHIHFVELRVRRQGRAELLAPIATQGSD